MSDNLDPARRPRPRPGRRAEGGIGSWRNASPLAKAALALVLILAVTVVAVVRDDETPSTPISDPTPTATAASSSKTLPPATTTTTATAEPTELPESTAEPTELPEPTATPRAVIECPEDCLVRVAALDAAAVAKLASSGIRPAYVGGGLLWGAAERPVIDRLAADGTELTVVLPDNGTLPLYVVRFREEVDEEAAEQIGEIVDRSDRQVLVRADVLPPPIAALAARGIAVEKVPPPRPRIRERPDRPRLVDAAELVDSVSDEEIERTIRDLQSIGVDDDELGSREMADRGNAIAADYLFRRMAALGVTVRYDDFVGDDGSYATNVVGELPGDDAGRGFLVVAHYDSMNDAGGPSPGADDNASGVAAMVEIARVLSGYRLPYPVQFVALTGEEVGFQGARTFVANLDDRTYVAAYNVDAVGSPVRREQIVINAGANSAELLTLLDEVNAEFEIGDELLLRQNELIVADDNTLRTAGIPAVLITRAVLGDSEVHHTADDVIDNMDVPSVGRVATLILLGLTVQLNE